MITKDLFTLHWTAWIDRWPKAPRQDVTTRMYYEILSAELDDQQFEHASQEVFRDCEYFPTPKEVIRAGNRWLWNELAKAREIEARQQEESRMLTTSQQKLLPPPPEVLEKMREIVSGCAPIDLTEERKRRLMLDQYEADGMENPPEIELPDDFVPGGKAKPKEEAC